MILQRLIEFTIRRRWFVLCAAGLMVIIGAAALYELPFDAFPDTTPVMVQINVSAPGWTPDEIERQVTFPVERELSGLAGLTEVRSVSKFGLSQVNLIFSDDIDIYLARQQASERLLSVVLPDGVEPPRLGPVSTGSGGDFPLCRHLQERRRHRGADGARLDHQATDAVGAGSGGDQRLGRIRQAVSHSH